MTDNHTPAPKAVEVLPERRSRTDLALEHAEYMAKDAERLLEALNEHAAALMALEESDEDDDESLEERVEQAEQDLGEHMSHMRSGVYEFRERRDRALAAAQAEKGNPWRAAVLAECMTIEAAYVEADPAGTVRRLIDWHVMNEHTEDDDAGRAAATVKESLTVRSDDYYQGWHDAMQEKVQLQAADGAQGAAS